MKIDTHAGKKSKSASVSSIARPRKKPPNTSARVTEGDIAQRAYYFYLARGCEHGHDLDDWLQAEREAG